MPGINYHKLKAVNEVRLIKGYAKQKKIISMTFCSSELLKFLFKMVFNLLPLSHCHKEGNPVMNWMPQDKNNITIH